MSCTRRGVKTEHLVARTFFSALSVSRTFEHLKPSHAHTFGSRHDWDVLHICAPSYKSSTLTACFTDRSSTCLTHFPESKDDAEALADFWSIQGDFICRHHNEPRVHLCVPKEETFSIPLKYIDVARSTHIDLDVMQEKRVNDYWECRREQKFVRFVERFHEVHFIERATSK